MRATNTNTSNSQEAKQAPSPSPSHRRPYPVSARSYKKKDYEYLSTFPRMAALSALSLYKSDAEILQARSDGDGDSDLSMTTSSTEYATSISSARSTSSAQSYAKDVIALVAMESHQHQHPHQHYHHVLSTQTRKHLPQISMDYSDLHAEINDDKLHNESHAELKDNDLHITGDLPAPTENGSVQVNAPIRPQAKAKPRPINKPAVLPKFGSWDTKNPSSGESYTLIFRRLRDEKKLGGLPICGSPTHSKTEGAVESSSAEGKKAKGFVHSKSRATRKDWSRRKAKGASPRDAAYYNRKRFMGLNFCCKASVLDD